MREGNNTGKERLPGVSPKECESCGVVYIEPWKTGVRISDNQVMEISVCKDIRRLTWVCSIFPVTGVRSRKTQVSSLLPKSEITIIGIARK